MYQLVKILGGRINHGEARVIRVAPIGEAIESGTPVSVTGGTVTPLSSASELAATHVVERRAEAGDASVYVSDLLPGMVFEVPVSGDISLYKIGTRYRADAASLSATEASAGKGGAVVYDIPDPEAGASLYVTFPCN